MVTRTAWELAPAKVDRLGVGERVTLIQGTVDDLPSQDRFDAATCIFVLHFLEDEDQQRLVQGIASRLRPGAPLILVAGVKEEGGVTDDPARAWQQYGELMGMPPDRMGATLENLLRQPTPAPPAGDRRRLTLGRVAISAPPGG